MSVNNDIVKESIMGNGGTLVFNYTVPYIDPTTLYLYVKSISTGITTELIKGTDYTILLTPPNLETVTIVINPGMSHFEAPPSVDDQLWLIRSTVIVQTFYDLNANSPWVPVQTEEAFDRLTLIIQEMDEELSRTIKSDPTGGASAELPVPEANRYIKWNATADSLENSTYDVDSFEVRITNNTNNITDLQNSLTNINNQLSALNTEVSNLQIDIDAVEAHNDAQDLVLGDHGSRIVALEMAVGGFSDQAAAILDLQNRMTAVEADILALQTDMQTTIDRVDAIEVRVTELETGAFSYRRTGRFILSQPSYVVDTPLPGLVFDYDYTSSSILYMEIRRAVQGQDWVESYTYSAVWANGAWGIVITQADIQTDLTGVNILIVQDMADKAAQLYFNAPNTLGGIYDPLNSWIVWTIEDKVRI